MELVGQLLAWAVLRGMELDGRCTPLPCSGSGAFVPFALVGVVMYIVIAVAFGAFEFGCLVLCSGWGTLKLDEIAVEYGSPGCVA